jgi:hypothetical protein
MREQQHHAIVDLIDRVACAGQGEAIKPHRHGPAAWSSGGSKGVAPWA